MPTRQSSGLAGLPPKPGANVQASPRTRRNSTRTGAASGSQAAGIAGNESGEGGELTVENFGPPAWRTVLNLRADLGWPDFYPSRPGFNQPEDVLTEENVKNGFSAKNYLASAAESFSMHGPVFNFLCGSGLDLLMRVGQEVMEQRDKAMPQLSERVYKLPPRVTYNETKRLQFLREAGNPAVSLFRLMQDRIPHGFKGVEALDAVFSPPAARIAGQPPQASEPFPLDRAVWFLRALGANEVVAHRSRHFPAHTSAPATSPAATAVTPGSTGPGTVPPGLGMTAPTTINQSSNEWYTGEFTSIYTTWLRTQLQQLVLPIGNTVAAAKLMSASKIGGGVLGDEKSRTRWLQKWEYSCALLKELHNEKLVSSRILLSWLADQLSNCNLAQLGFVSQLLGGFLLDAVNNLSLARVIVRAACYRSKEIAASPAAEALDKTTRLLRYTVETLCQADLDVLLSPPLWRHHADLVTEICANIGDSGDIHAMRLRSERMFYRLPAVESDSSPRRNQMDELSKLDSISGETDMTELCRSFFDGGSSPTANVIDETKLEDKVFMVLNWSMGLRNLGIHRPYGAYTLLRIWADQREIFLARRHAAHSKNGYARPSSFIPDLFPVLYKWLDTSIAAKKPRNVQAIGITFGEFTRQGLFSYSRYMQTLIAYGQTARAKPNGPRSHHLDLLRAMPIFVEANDLLQQRRMALSGDSPEQRWRDEAEEQAVIQAFREECMEYVPELYGFKTYGRSAEYKNEIDHPMPSTDDMTRFVFLQARFELAQHSEARLKRGGKVGGMTSSAFVRVIQILHLCQGYSSIADLLGKGLEFNRNLNILRCIIDTLRRHADVFTAMDRWPRLTEKLLIKFNSLDEKQVYHPRICRLLLDLASAGRIGEDEAFEVRAYLEEHRQSWLNSIPEGSDASPMLPEIAAAISNGHHKEAVQLGVDIYQRHGPFEAWDRQWWEAIMAALNTVAAGGEMGKLEVSIRVAGAHIDQVTERLALELDSVVAQWLDGFSKKRQVESLSSTGPLMPMILILVTRRRLSTVTVLNHLLYPLWKQLAPVAMNASAYLSDAQLQAVESSLILMEQLFLTKPPHQHLPPLDQEEALIAQTSRAEVFTNYRTPDLIRHLPLLVVLGSSANMPDQIRAHVGRFFEHLSLIPAFKTAIFRHLPLLKDAFLTSDWSRPGIGPEIEAGLVETLKGMMSESSPRDGVVSQRNGFSGFASLAAAGGRISAWRWTSHVLEMRVEFKRLANRINNALGPEATEAKGQLRQLIGDSLNKGTSADEADLLCETFRSIDTVVQVEVLIVGVDTLVGLLRQVEVAESRDEVARAVKGIGFVQRIIDAAGSAAASTDNAVQSAKLRLLDALASGFASVERHLGDADKLPLPAGMAHAAPEPGIALKVLLDLLKFVLGLGVQEHAPIVAIQRPVPEYSRVVASLLKVLIVLHTAEQSLTVELQDMLVYVIDAAPSNARNGIHTALVTEAVSPGFQAALRHLPALQDLLPAHVDERNLHLNAVTTQAEISLPLDERPWEMFDYMAPLPGKTRHRDQYLASKPYSDYASIPASLFDPLIKRDTIPGAGQGDNEDTGSENGWLDYVAERDLGDGVSGEPIASRFLATDAYAGPDEFESGSGSANLPVSAPGLSGELIDLSNISPTTNGSATSSVPLALAPRRQSTRIAMHASASGTGTNNDPIAIDDEDDGQADSASRAPTTHNGDSEDETDDTSSEEEEKRRPPAKRPRVGGKAPAKKTAGKAPARKTVGGKAVARKGGKSVKGVRR